MMSLRKTGILTYTIDESDNWYEINDALLEIFESTREVELIKHDEHATLFILKTNIPIINYAEYIYTALLKYIKTIREQEYIYILISMDNNVFEIVLGFISDDKYRIQLYSHKDGKLIKNSIIG